MSEARSRSSATSTILSRAISCSRTRVGSLLLLVYHVKALLNLTLAEISRS